MRLYTIFFVVVGSEWAPKHFNKQLKLKFISVPCRDWRLLKDMQK